MPHNATEVFLVFPGGIARYSLAEVAHPARVVSQKKAPLLGADEEE